MSTITLDRKKPNILVSTKDMPREEWLRQRTRGIGGSDVAAIAGLDKYKSIMQVYLEKIGEWEFDEEQSEAAEIGSEQEEYVAHKFMQRFERDMGTPIKLRRTNRIYSHPDHPYMIANLDRDVVGENAGLECKTASEYLLHDWEGEDIPNKYMLQIQHYMFVKDYDYMYIAVLIGGNKFRWKRVERDEEIIQYIVQICSDFWQLVENRIPPAMDGSKASGDTLKALYPRSIDKGIQLEQEAVLLAEQFEVWDQAEKEAKYKKDEAANRLKQMLGDHSQGFLNNGRTVNWKSSKEFDEAMFAATYPDLYAQALLKLDKDALKKLIGKKMYDEFTIPGNRRFTILKAKEA